VHETSGWFRDGTADLTGKATNQLWRNCLLAAAAELAGEYATASVVVVSLADDPGANTAIAGVTAAMTDPNRCRSVPLERIVEVRQADRTAQSLGVGVRAPLHRPQPMEP
jgi:hypothetical protein